MRNLLNKIKMFFIKTSSQRYISYLRGTGIQVGKNFNVRGSLRTISIDTTRPSLITIGDNVTINTNFTLFTHDFVSGVFLNLYNEFLPSSGKVVIGNNVRFGINCTVLKNVSIGDNCFIAAGSIVTKDVPSNSIVAGVPAKVIGTIDAYYERRKIECIIEAKEYARSIRSRFNREPIPADFQEEFPLFVDGSNYADYPEIPISQKLGESLDFWLENHNRLYDDFNAFINSINEEK